MPTSAATLSYSNYMRLKYDMLTELSQWIADFCWQTRTCWNVHNTHQEGSEGATAQGSRLPYFNNRNKPLKYKKAAGVLGPATITAKDRHAATD